MSIDLFMDVPHYSPVFPLWRRLDLSQIGTNEIVWQSQCSSCRVPCWPSGTTDCALLPFSATYAWTISSRRPWTALRRFGPQRSQIAVGPKYPLSFNSPYSMFAPTTAAICIMLIVWPSFSFVRLVTLPDLLLEFVFLKIGSSLESATMNLPAFSGFPFSLFV